LRTEVPQLKSVDLHEQLDDETTRLILMAGERAMKIGKLNGA
jgi:F-type H+-transporting ATPase subunit alpha